MAAADLTNLFKRHWLPICGAVVTVAILAFGPVLSVPFQAFLDFCFGEAADGTEMSGGLLMWLTMRPAWSAIALGVCLVAVGVLFKSIVAELPQPAKAKADSTRQAVPATSNGPARQVTAKDMDESTLYAAMIWAAEVTGGFTPERLALLFEDLTGMKAPNWGRKIALAEQSRPHPAMVIIFDKVQDKSDQRTIVALVLAVCLTRRKLSKQAAQLVWLLASKFQMTKAEVQELYDTMRTENKVTQAA